MYIHPRSDRAMEEWLSPCKKQIRRAVVSSRRNNWSQKVIERTQSDTVPSSTSRRHDEIFRAVALAREASLLLKSNTAIDLSRLEIELTRAMRKVPIGSSEGRRLFAL